MDCGAAADIPVTNSSSRPSVLISNRRKFCNVKSPTADVAATSDDDALIASKDSLTPNFS